MTDPSATHEFWYESAGARLYAVERGRGPAIVFMHGGLADHRAALFRVGSLAAEHRLIAPDVRAAGRSHHAGPLSWQLLADDLAALLDHLGLARAVIGGVSAGSGVALAFALRHPRRVRALLLVSPVYLGSERGLNEAQRHAMQRMDDLGRRAAVDGIAAIFPLFAPLPPPIRDVALTMAAGFDPASVAATTRFLASGAQPFADLADLAAIAAPTLVVPGTDPEHPAEVAGQYARTFPCAALVDPGADLLAPLAGLLRGVA
jgi:pimeloyl-ACP methyl ester carboxylesterase